MSNIQKQLKEFPQQFNWEPHIERLEKLSLSWDNILVCGMGGSALPGFLLQSLMQNTQINIHANYGLPANLQKNTLVVVISYSGNTEEALSAYETAKSEGVALAAISSDGKLQEMAKKDDVPFVKIPDYFQPRIALGYQFRALVELVEAQKPKTIKIDAERAEKDAKSLAEKIGKSTPLFYASRNNKALAYIAKIQTNENAKRHAFFNVFPELNHNELEAFKNKNDLFVVIIKDNSDDKRIQRRMDLTTKLIKENGYKTEVIDISNNNWYNRTIYSVLFTSWLAYYLAVNAGIDPELYYLIEKFKRSLRSQ